MRLETDRLLLRPWTEHDRVPFAALNADPLVMEHFPSLLSRAESDKLAALLDAELVRDGWGLWAVEVKNGPAFIGYVGLRRVPFSERFTPATEVGWRLARTAWGQGYATEGGRAAIDFGFHTLGLEEIVSFTVPGNRRSLVVMRRLGMVEDGRFDHPRLPVGHALREHVLYRLEPRPRP